MSAHASMNRIYRLIWSEVLGAWVAVAENARGRGKRSSRLLAPTFATAATDINGSGETAANNPASVLRANFVAAALLGASLSAHAAPPVAPAATALPTGATVVAGSAAVSQSGAAMTVTQASARSAIDWQSFNLGAQASINFVQPSASAVTLNRVLNTQPSQIFGKITANGQVFLSNPNGVYFSPSASVDVGALVATTHAMSNADFMAGGTTFTRDGATGSVINEGHLQAGLGGYIALLAPEVINSGIIIARAGTVALAAGESMKLQFDDSNTLAAVLVKPSTIAALVENRQAVLAPGGLILLSAQAGNALQGGVVNNSGSLEASGMSSAGGRILLDASDRISHSGTIRADAASGSGANGGSVRIVADLGNPTSLTEISGLISARGDAPGGGVGGAIGGASGGASGGAIGGAIGGTSGGASSGAGGAVETSGSRLKIADTARIDVRGAPGKTGTWLLDPDGFTIGSGSGDDISGATLSTNLGSADVAIASTSGNGSSGNVNVNDAVNWNANKLTLTATNDVNINAVMSAAGSASLDLEPGSGKVKAAFGAGNTFAGKVDFSGSGVLTMNNQAYTVINSLGADPTDMTSGTLQGAQASQNTFYALGSDIDASPTASWNTSGQTGFTPIAITGAAFDGLGHVVSNLTLNRITSNLALIATAAFGPSTLVRNVGVVGGTVSGSQYAAGLVGINYGTVSNSFATIAVSGFQFTGGLVGENRAGVITDSYATGIVSGTSQVGGLVGYNNGMVQNSYATGAVTGSTAFIGGLVGRNYFGTVSSSYATGNVIGSQTVGGLVGINQEAGGAGSNIINSYAMGTVSGATNIGGLVGENGSNITNSYAVGNVSISGGNTSVGGLVGIETVDGATPVSVITNSFWDTETSGQPSSSGGTGMTTVQMKDRTTFTGAGWDFSAPIWQIKASANNGYPCLAVFASCPSSIPLSVHVNGSQSSSIYGDAVGSFTYALYNGGTLLDAGTEAALGISIGGSSLFGGAPVQGSGAGTYHIVYASGLTLGGANADNYAFVPNTPLNYTILQRPLTLVGTRAYYGGTNIPIAALSASNLVGSDCATGLANCGMGGAATVASKNVSAGSQSLALNGLTLGNSTLAANYTLSGASGTASITPRSVGTTASATSRVYNGLTNAVASVSPDDSIVFGDMLSFAYTDAAFVNKNVGNNKAVAVTGITMGGTDAGNYALASTTATAHANITPLALSVTASGVDRAYDGSLVDPLTFQKGSGFITGDSVTVSGAGSFADKNVGSAKPVSVSAIALSGTDALNYTLSNTTASTSAAITQRTVTASATGTNRVYDATVADLSTLSLSDNVVFGDSIGLSSTASNFVDKNVGVGKLVNVTGISLNGNDAGNYQLASTSATTHASVTARPITVSATGTNRVYDGTTSTQTSVAVANTVLEGDMLQAVQGAASFGDKNVGVAKPVAVTGITLSGVDALNYSVTNPNVSTTASITARPLAVTASGANRVYDGTTATGTSLADDRIAGDNLQLSGSAGNFIDKNVGNGKRITITGLALSGEDAGNYSLPGNSVVAFGSITPRPLTITAIGTDRTYDGSTADLVTLADNRIAGDSLSLSGTGNFADKNVGNAKPVSITGIALGGADAGNYSFSRTGSTTASIAPRLLTVGATGIDRLYDGTVVATVVLGDDRVGGDQLALADAAAAFADANPGIAKPIAVSGISVGGTDAGNYHLSNISASTSATILPPAAVVPVAPVVPVVPVVPVTPVVPIMPVVPVVPIAPADPQIPAAEVPTTPANGTPVTELVPRLPIILPVLPTTTRVLSPLTLTAGDAGSNTTSGTVSDIGAIPVQASADAGRSDRPASSAVAVSLVRAATAGSNGVITVSIPADMISRGEAFSFALPSVAAEALAVGGASASISRMDGAPLPAWLKYVTQSHSFDVSAVPADALPFEVLIVVDGRRWSVVLEARVGN